MYNLYRAWFGDSGVPRESYPRLEDTLSPPDTVVRVGNEGEYQFVAHKGVLAAHSGYLKALLANTSAPRTATTTAPDSTSFPSCGTIVHANLLSPVKTSQATTPRQPVTSVSVSSIGGEAFAPLLNYMYTGRLEVTLDNVYSVLLATHLLHMPGALEQCRAALLRLRAPPPLPTPIPIPVPNSASPSTSITMTSGSRSILRPIPSRLVVGPPLCWPQPMPIYPRNTTTAHTPVAVQQHLSQLQSSVLMQSALPPGISVPTTSALHDTNDPSNNYRIADLSGSPKTSSEVLRARDRSRSTSPITVTTSVTLPFVAAAAAAAFTTAFASSDGTTRNSPSPRAASASPPSSRSSRSSSPRHRNERSGLACPTEDILFRGEADRREHRHSSGERRNGEDEKSPGRRGLTAANGSQEEKSSSYEFGKERGAECSSGSSKGRALRRKSRGIFASGTATTCSTESTPSGVLSVIYDVACCDGPVKFHRVLNENYSSLGAGSGTGIAPSPRHQRPPSSCLLDETGRGESIGENDENGRPAVRESTCEPRTSEDANGEGNHHQGGSGSSYTCGYCRHTFKSHYCYRKHTKRHLLPTRLNALAAAAPASRQHRQQESARQSRKEVRLLDLNVQYYPCKICGCKFPSYYFVHKHRKLCHANLEEKPRPIGDPREETVAQTSEQEASANNLQQHTSP